MDEDEFFAFVAGAYVAVCLFVLDKALQPPRNRSTAYLTRSASLLPPAHCWGCEIEARELEQFGHSHVPVKHTPTVAPAAKGK